MGKGWLFLLALAAPVAAQERVSADSTDLPPAVRALMHKAVTESFIDPGSAQYDYDYVRLWEVNGVPHFLVCGRVNAKNRMGGYAGRQTYIAHVTRQPDGSLLAERSGVTTGEGDVATLGVNGAVLGGMYRALCLDAAGQPRRP